MSKNSVVIKYNNNNNNTRGLKHNEEQPKIKDIKQTQALISNQCLCKQTISIEGVKNQNLIITCSRKKCKKSFHYRCLKINELNKKIPLFKEYFECPFCLLLNCDPLHEVIHTLIEPYLLNDSNLRNMAFEITQEMLKKMKHNQSIGIEVRSILLEENSNLQAWPKEGQLIINDKEVLKFKKLSKDSSLKRRRDQRYFFRIPNDCKLGLNTIEIQNKTVEKGYTYFAGVYFIQKLSVSEMMKKVTEYNVSSFEESKKRVINYFKTENQDLQVQSVIIPLTCILTQQRLCIPSRGSLCTHLNCFSLESFISAWEKNKERKWNCPICKQRASNIVIDQYFEEILKKTYECGYEGNEVVINRDGTFSLMTSNTLSAAGRANDNNTNNNNTNNPSNKKNSVNEIIDLDSLDDENSNQSLVFRNGQSNFTELSNDEKSITNAQKTISRHANKNSYTDDKDNKGYKWSDTEKTNKSNNIPQKGLNIASNRVFHGPNKVNLNSKQEEQNKGQISSTLSGGLHSNIKFQPLEALLPETSSPEESQGIPGLKCLLRKNNPKMNSMSYHRENNGIYPLNTNLNQDFSYSKLGLQCNNGIYDPVSSYTNFTYSRLDVQKEIQKNEILDYLTRDNPSFKKNITNNANTSTNISINNSTNATVRVNANSITNPNDNCNSQVNNNGKLMSKKIKKKKKQAKKKSTNKLNPVFPQQPNKNKVKSTKKDRQNKKINFHTEANCCNCKCKCHQHITQYQSSSSTNTILIPNLLSKGYTSNDPICLE